MFFGKKSVASIINSDIRIKGDFACLDSTLILGVIDGSVDGGMDKADSTIHLGKGSSVNGEFITAVNLIIQGTVYCKEIRVERDLQILNGAYISDCVIYSRGQKIEQGASLHNCIFKDLDKSSKGEII